MDDLEKKDIWGQEDMSIVGCSVCCHFPTLGYLRVLTTAL